MKVEMGIENWLHFFGSVDNQFLLLMLACFRTIVQCKNNDPKLNFMCKHSGDFKLLF